MLANDIFFWKYLFYPFILTSTKYWLSWMKLSQNYIIRWIFEIYRSGLKTVILSEKIQHFNIAHTSILPRTGIIFLFLVVFQIPTEKDFRMKYSDSNYGKKHKKSRNLKVVLLLSLTLYSSLSPYRLFHTPILRYSTSMISPDPNSESHWVDIIDVRYLRK